MLQKQGIFIFIDDYAVRFRKGDVFAVFLKSRPYHSRRDITRQIYSTIICTIVTLLQKISGFSKAVARDLETIPLRTHFTSSNIDSECYGFIYVFVFWAAYECSLILLRPFYRGM